MIAPIEGVYLNAAFTVSAGVFAAGAALLGQPGLAGLLFALAGMTFLAGVVSWGVAVADYFGVAHTND